LFHLPPWQITASSGKRSAQQQQQQLPFLWGVLRYEDHVEDEWWAVWLLLQLSQQQPHLCIRCWDDDGEFLLIEVSSAGITASSNSVVLPHVVLWMQGLGWRVFANRGPNS
jgi:hypothetical protein